MFRTLLKASALILLGTLSLSAQNSTSVASSVPRLVNYSGKTIDAQNKPISGTVGVTFAIYKDQEGGAALWMETQNVVADTKGNYTVRLGSTKPDGLGLDLFGSAEARWLGVSVNGGTEQPRVLLLSVPYALKAADAETIGGLPPSAFLRTDASAGLKAPAKFDSSRSGQAKQSPQANPNVTGKGTVNFVPLWDSTSDILNSSIFQKNANVGIGTTAPAATLDVSGKGDIRDTLTLFPKGTDPTLAVNGTAFKVDSTGKVTFVSGQTFPGKGTVTSVGMSAPTSDFTVSGSPITKSGTLGLSWNVAPTSSDTANAIVKRDSGGGFTAGQIIGTSTGVAILGQSSGTGGGSDGVDGVTSSAGASGVAGINTSGGIGVYGTGGIGTFSTGTTTGVWGRSTGDGNAVIGFNNSSNYTLYLDNSYSFGGGIFYGSSVNGYCIIDAKGNLMCSGSKSAVVPVDAGARKVALYAVESPENWFEDFGSGQLSSGKAVINLEPTFAQTVNTANGYHVFLTPRGECEGLYVSNVNGNSFTVRELHHGVSNVEFDFRIVAPRKGYENIRLADKTSVLNAKPQVLSGAPLTEMRGHP